MSVKFKSGMPTIFELDILKMNELAAMLKKKENVSLLVKANSLVFCCYRENSASSLHARQPGICRLKSLVYPQTSNNLLGYFGEGC